jgi:hypothetical protein
VSDEQENGPAVPDDELAEQVRALEAMAGCSESDRIDAIARSVALLRD